MICIPVVCAPPRYSIISSLSSKWPGSIPFCLIWFSLSWTFKINVRHICSNFLFRCSVASCRFCLAVNFRIYSTDAFKIVPLFHLWSLKFFKMKKFLRKKNEEFYVFFTYGSAWCFGISWPSSLILSFILYRRRLSTKRPS